MVTVKTTIDRLISNIDYTLYVDIVSDNVVTCDNTLFWLDRSGWNFKVKDADNELYTVTNFTINEGFTLVPDNLGVVFSGDKLYFDKRATYLLGKPLSANNEYQDIANFSPDKLPLIWLVTTWEEDLGTKEKDYLYGNNILMYFLMDANEESWLTDKHYSESITVTRNLLERFILAIDDDTKCDRTNLRIKPWERFGRESIQGAREHIIDDYLSGHELMMNLNISKGC